MARVESQAKEWSGVPRQELKVESANRRDRFSRRLRRHLRTSHHPPPPPPPPPPPDDPPPPEPEEDELCGKALLTPEDMLDISA